MYFIDVIRGKNITFVYHKILYNMKEEELIEQMKNGNNIAFAALYDYYCQKVYNFTKLYVTSSDTVAEIVQDVFVKFWEARHLLDNNKKVEGFLFVITRNIIFNKARSRMREDMFKMTILREIFLMSREENMTYREIAARCGIGEKAVERHIHLTLKFLKKNLLLFILFSMLPE